MKAPPPASAIAPAATSQKFSLTIFLLRAPPEKNSKKEREISARFRPPSIRAVRRGFNADSVLPNYFSGEKDLAKPRLISRPQKGVWGMNACGLLKFLTAILLTTYCCSRKEESGIIRISTNIYGFDIQTKN